MLSECRMVKIFRVLFSMEGMRAAAGFTMKQFSRVSVNPRSQKRVPTLYARHKSRRL